MDRPVRRGRIEIISSILTAAKDGVIKTRLMYQSNLDFRGLDKYLDFLVSKKFLERSDSGKTMYKTTQKGLEFLQTYGKLEDSLYEKEG